MTTINPNIKAIHTRQKARKKLIQALYQWLITGSTPREIEAQFLENQPDFKKIDRDFFFKTLKGISLSFNELEDKLKPFLDIKFKDIDPIEQGILTLGLYELENHLETPYKVVINESVDLAKRFGGTDSHKFVNGVMDKLAKKYRPLENKPVASK